MEFYLNNKSKLKIFSFSKRVKITCCSVFPTNNCQGKHFHLIKLNSIGILNDFQKMSYNKRAIKYKTPSYFFSLNS